MSQRKAKQIKSIKDLTPDPANVNKGTERGHFQLDWSLTELGAGRSILADADGVVLAGNKTLEVAADHQLPVRVVETDGSELIVVQRRDLRLQGKGNEATKARQLAIADNRVSETNYEADINALFEHQASGVDLSPLYRQDEIDAMMANLTPVEMSGEPSDAEPQIDKAAELNKKWECKAGDLWAIGDHRLLCGDSTKVEDVARAMGGEKAALCFTSPPYGQQRDYRDGATEKVSEWDALMQGVFSVMPTGKDGQVFVNLGLIHDDGEWLPYWDKWINWMREQGWRRFGWYVWDQGPAMPGDWAGRLAPSFEFIFHFNKESRKPNKTKEKLPDSIEINDHGGGQRGKDGIVKERSNPAASLQTHKIPDSVIRVMRHKARGVECDHPAVFPVRLPEEIISAYTNREQVAYEPFCGSGTTLVAAQNLNRKCYAIEISPNYCAVILQRMSDAFPSLKIERVK